MEDKEGLAYPGRFDANVFQSSCKYQQRSTAYPSSFMFQTSEEVEISLQHTRKNNFPANNDHEPALLFLISFKKN